MCKQMAISKVQTLMGLSDPTSSGLHAHLEEETATQSPRSSANSCYTSSVETPWSCSRATLEDDCSSCADEDETGSKTDQHDDYYSFLREFAGSYDGSLDQCESDRSDLDEDGGQEEENNRGSWSRSSSRSGPQQQRPPPVTPKSEDGVHRKISNGSVEIIEVDNDDAFSDSDDEGPDRQDNFEDALDRRRNSVDYPAPSEDDYDVVKAIQQYAQQRTGSRMQQWQEDVQEAIRLRNVQAYSLYAPIMNARGNPKVRSHYARVRMELLMQAKAMEARLAQVIAHTRVPGTSLPEPPAA